VQAKKRILVAPLNRGLGHATRCIPIIEALENHGFEPIIASDGVALAFLKKEFPLLTALELPPCHLHYTGNGTFFKLKALLRAPKMFSDIHREGKIVEELVIKYKIDGIISDNRPGAYSRWVASVVVTHELNSAAEHGSQLPTQIHRLFLRRYRECWIPDVKSSPNLSGKLGHSEESTLNLKYIGPISRLHKKITEKKYDLMVLLSGPEPERTQLQEKLIKELKNYNGTVVFIKGNVEEVETATQKGSITFYNFMTTDNLEQAINESEIILCRPGYSTIMDLAKMGKKAFFIPTPGLEEQEYLAKKLKKSGVAPYVAQAKFKLADLQKTEMYKGLKEINGAAKWKDLFSLFEGKGKL